MKGWVIPAPAPWANTKHACACAGRVKSPETEPDFAIAISSCCGLMALIELKRER